MLTQFGSILVNFEKGQQIQKTYFLSVIIGPSIVSQYWLNISLIGTLRQCSSNIGNIFSANVLSILSVAFIQYWLCIAYFIQYCQNIFLLIPVNIYYVLTIFSQLRQYTNNIFKILCVSQLWSPSLTQYSSSAGIWVSYL